MRVEIPLKYGCNPHQVPAYVSYEGLNLPVEVLHGAPGYINILDALRGWQLVRELAEVTLLPTAASFKHVNPVGAAVAGHLDDSFRCAQFLRERDLSPLATAYAKARSGDRVAAFGDFICLSDRVDISCAGLIKREVSDGVIAPGYDDQALEILRQKRGGKYLILKMDPSYQSPKMEIRQEFGLHLFQQRNEARIGRSLFTNVVTRRSDLSERAMQDLLIATVIIKHTQSNSMCVALNGQAIGIGAGQQSRIACTRIACDKADNWLLQQHPKTLNLEFNRRLSRTEKFNLVDQYIRWDSLAARARQALTAELKGDPDPITGRERVDWITRFAAPVLSSDAYIPFRDNIDRAHQSGIAYVVQSGGSSRDDEVTAAAEEYDMVMIHSGLRLFLH